MSEIVQKPAKLYLLSFCLKQKGFLSNKVGGTSDVPIWSCICIRSLIH